MIIHHSRPSIDTPDINAVVEVLKSRYLSADRTTTLFEKRLSRFIGRRYSITTNSGTAALHLVLLALNLKPRDEIIIPSFVCASVLNAIMYVEAKPVISDIELDNYNLSFPSTRQKITRHTKAIILPYMFGGSSAKINKFLQLNIPLIEDCAHSLGASLQGKRLGSFGSASIFSFYATKVIATGQGGMILTNSSKIFKRVKDLTEYDERDDYKVRYNYKMTDLQAALGIAQLNRIDAFMRRRREIAKYYNTIFSKSDIITPPDDPGHIYYRYVIRIKAPLKQFILRLKQKGIEIKPPVFKPLHRYLKLDQRLFPNTEEAFRKSVSLPIHPDLTDNQIRFIAGSVLEAL